MGDAYASHKEMLLLLAELEETAFLLCRENCLEIDLLVELNEDDYEARRNPYCDHTRQHIEFFINRLKQQCSKKSR